ncbi:MAG: hypothetical protein DWP95_10300 [Proteobacteria bacterium]|nr:MAG: hypothetical protein DWP95_10300 [Pseudomonadota bacterium]
MSDLIPNSFQVPNAFVDVIMSDISGNAVKCYLLIVRKTVGWGKEKDRISVSQFRKYTGISKDGTITKITKELEDFGLITRHKELGKITEFSLRLPPKNHPPLEGVPPIKGTTPERGDTTPPERGSTKPTNTKPNKKKNKQKEIDTSKGFEKWWSIYPKKVGKKTALKIWEKSKLFNQSDELIQKLSEQVERCESMNRSDKSLIAHPSTYLNQERWDDEIIPIPEKSNAISKTNNQSESYADKLNRECEEFERSMQQATGTRFG